MACGIYTYNEIGDLSNLEVDNTKSVETVFQGLIDRIDILEEDVKKPRGFVPALTVDEVKEPMTFYLVIEDWSLYVLRNGKPHKMGVFTHE